MSVEQWKRVISLTVLGLICILLTVSIVLGVKYKNLKTEMQGENMIDLSDYDGITAEEGKKIFHYLDGLATGETLEYQKKYPELYVENDFRFVDTEEKVCYLTFDDGPTEGVTTEVLDVLKKNQIKATFFVIGKEGSEKENLYKRIVEEGHTIGIHSYSHNYEGIYESVDTFLEDFDKMSDKITSLTGVKPELFRFPGGSVNEYNEGIYEEIIAEMLRRGYVYHDWNISSRDTDYEATAEELLKNVAYAADEMENDIVVLMHDGENHETTAEALPAIIKELKRQGFTFAALDKSVAPICFGY